MFGAVALFAILLIAMIIIAVMRFSTPPVEESPQSTRVGMIQPATAAREAWPAVIGHGGGRV